MTRALKNNERYYYLYSLFSGLIFTLPIWVLFYGRYIGFPEMATMSVVSALTTMLLEIPTGALADLIGRKRTVISGVVITAMAYFWVIGVTEYWQFMLYSALTGIGMALISGADSALLYDSLKELGRENYFGKVIVKSGFFYRSGLIIASFTGGFLYSWWFGLPYLAKGIVFIIGGFWVWLMVEPKIDSEKFSLKNYVKQTRQGLAELTKSTYVKRLAVYYLLVGGITWSCLYYFNQPFALDFDYSETEMSWLFGSIYLLSTLILYWLTATPGLLTRIRVYLGFPVLMTLAYLPGLVVPKLLVPLLLIGSQIAGSARFAILDKYTNKEFTPKNRATALSTLNMGVHLLFSVIVFFGGQIQDQFNTKLVYTGFGLLSLLVVLPMGLVMVRDYRGYLASQRKAL